MTSDKRLVSERFPRTSKYHCEWVIASASGGANALEQRIAWRGFQIGSIAPSEDGRTIVLGKNL